MFQKLWGHQKFENVMDFTLAEAQRQEHEAFLLSKDGLNALIGLYILCDVLKGRDKSLFNFGDEEIWSSCLSKNYE